MKTTEFKLDYSLCENDCKEKFPVIIVSAGSARRMKGINKTFAVLNGIPVLARTLLAFECHPEISRIIVVCKDEDKQKILKLSDEYKISKLSDLVSGGNTRQDSVKNGMGAVADCEAKVLIHDGARPLVSKKVIDNVIKTAADNDSVTCAVPVKDTVKQLNYGNTETLPREKLVLVQTPQCVNVKIYLDVLNKTDDLSTFTDDTSIMESAGVKTAICDGDCKNIKITTKEDLLIAKAFLNSEEDL